MVVTSNPYQHHLEPSNQEVWYSSLVKEVSNRRDASKLDRYSNKNVITLFDNTSFIEFIRKSQLYTPVTKEDQYYFIEAGKRLRPDLISYELYGTPIFYWIILSDNNMVSSLQAKTNLTLRVPSLQSVVNNERLI